MRYWTVAYLLILAAPMARAADAMDDWAAGKRLYTAKCARCHKFYDPAKYDDRTWNEWMGKMRQKAKLNDEQYAKLSGYLQTLRPTRGPVPIMNEKKEQ